MTTNTERLAQALRELLDAQTRIDELPMFPTKHAVEAAQFKLYDAREAARAALSQHAAEQVVEPLGYLSEHTGPDGPHKWQFSKTPAGIYRDTALRVFAIHPQGGTSAAAIEQAKPTLCRYRTRIKGQKAPWTDWTECSAAAADEFERVNCEQWEYEVQRLYAAPKQAEQQAGPVAEFRGRRLTPEGTTEFWGVMLCDPMQDPPKGAKLYAGPVNDPVPSDWRSVIPGGRFTDQWESSRVADFNDGWNAYRKAVIASLSAAPSQERDKEDAERYRWLRDEAWGCGNRSGPHLVVYKPGLMPSAVMELAEEAADAAIDAEIAARAAGKESGQ